MNRIEFYKVSELYGEFSNFAPFPVDIDGKRWPTTEHYFQAQKFPGTEREEGIRGAASPMIAARMGRSRQFPLRADWEEAKDEIMYRALMAKFIQHPKLCSWRRAMRRSSNILETTAIGPTAATVPEETNSESF